MSEMNMLNFIILLLAHLLCGVGILGWFRVKMNPVMTLSLGTIIGLVVHSFVPIVQDMAGIRLTEKSVAIGIMVSTLVAMSGWYSGRKIFQESVAEYQINFKAYELPFLAIIGFILYVAAYRCYYFPVTPRDALSGPETIAKYAVKEGTLANSFFNINLESTNNQHKSPYLIGLQIIYKFFVQTFGQVWLNTMVFSLIIFLYSALKEKIHSILAGLILFLFIATPECFAYTLMILYDYSNMVLYAMGAYVLSLYWNDRKNSQFWLAAFLFGLSTFIRTETLILLSLFLPLFFIDWYQKKYPLKKLVLGFGGLMGISLLMYVFVMNFYLPISIPSPLNVSGDLNKDWSNIGLFFTRFGEVNDRLIFSEFGVNLWNYFIYIFIFILMVNTIIYRQPNKQEAFWLYMVLVIYLGIPLMYYIIPILDLNNSSKRAMFKILPLMLFYMANSRLFTRISQAVWNWEGLTKTTEYDVVKSIPPQTKAQNPKSSHKKKKGKH